MKREFLGFRDVDNVFLVAFEEVIDKVLAVVVGGIVRPEVGTLVLSTLEFLGILQERVDRKKVLEMNAKLLVGVRLVLGDLDDGVLFEAVLLAVVESEDGVSVIDVVVAKLAAFLLEFAESDKVQGAREVGVERDFGDFHRNDVAAFVVLKELTDLGRGMVAWAAEQVKEAEAVARATCTSHFLFNPPFDKGGDGIMNRFTTEQHSAQIHVHTRDRVIKIPCQLSRSR